MSVYYSCSAQTSRQACALHCATKPKYRDVAIATVAAEAWERGVHPPTMSTLRPVLSEVHDVLPPGERVGHWLLPGRQGRWTPGGEQLTLTFKTECYTFVSSIRFGAARS